jgi:hypothetical protein
MWIKRNLVREEVTDVMNDEEIKLEEIETSHKLGRYRLVPKKNHGSVFM